MKCPRCAEENQLLSERCVHCGADLFAPPPPFAATKAAVFYILFGGWLLLVVIQRAIKPAREPWIDYLVFIGVGIAVVLRIVMLREALSMKRSEIARRADPRTASIQTTISTPAAATSVARLHSLLGGGLVLVAAVLLLLTALGVTPILPPDSTSPQIAYALVGIVVVLVAVALFVFKPRVPRQEPGQSDQEYWSTPEIATKVLLVWFVLEGAGTIASVGYLLLGRQASALAMALAIISFWLCGPSQFAKG